ncbi:MAG: hypothetical protein E6Q97_38865 [Desulfurellales bacterium]|nr:MAG: hypothetical protein E6Q97_38865 [Desulfurellales bacterium]
MGWGPIKRDRADIEFSHAIRTRDRWTCQVCSREFPEGSQSLHCSHFFGRRMEGTRFDPENCDSLCSACHLKYGDKNRKETVFVDGMPVTGDGIYRQWKINRLGKEAFDRLEVRAHSYHKKDRAMALLEVRAFAAEVGAGFSGGILGGRTRQRRRK